MSASAHNPQWHDRLQDLVDGELSGHDRAVTEAHLAECSTCRSHLIELQRIDAALKERTPHISLDPAFDRTLLARIHAVDSGAQERARRRIEQEFQDSVQELAQGWRRGLALLAGGVIAAIALALAVLSWIDATGVAAKLVSGAADGLGARHAAATILLISAVIAGSIGAVVGRWLARTVD